MVEEKLKAETMVLMDKKATLEAEMHDILEFLCESSGAGHSGNLVDSEGFPRADINIPAVIAHRRRLAELRNDLKALVETINQNISVLYPAKRAPPNYTASKKSCASTPKGTGLLLVRPVVVIDEIIESSPAAEDGLELGDQVVKFGHVEFGENLNQRLAAEAQTYQGQEVHVTVLRQGSPMSFTVTPRAWEGSGLLGCHFRIL